MATKVLILGAGGFIGRHLLEVLSQGQHRNIEILKQKVILEDYDSTVNQVLEQQADLVLQLAWTASSTPNYRHESTNLLWSRFTIQLANRCREVDLPFMGIGSGVETLLAPKDLYSSSKRDTFLGLEQKIAQDEIAWARLGYVFDEISESPSVVREICTSLRNGTQPRLSDPDAEHDFVHVRDVANGIIKIIENNGRGLYEIGSGQSRSVSELARALGYEAPILEQVNSPSKTGNSQINRMQELGWHPVHTELFFDGD